MSQDRHFLLRPLEDSDAAEYGQMLHASFNTWYGQHGWGKDYFTCEPRDAAIFYDIYNDLTPGHCVAAVDASSGRLAGACFYHPRPCHVSLGIMAVHPDCGGQGVGRSLVDFILRFTRENGYPSCRLVGSAMNMNSFSLYNRSGFEPRGAYHDMVLAVPDDPSADCHAPGADRVRDAVLADVGGMADLEMEVSAIRREIDYRYAIENPRRMLHAAVYANDQRGIDGFLISIRHPALSMLGPCVARSEEIAVALLLVPMEKRKMVETFYRWGAVNVETHLKQVWGEFQPFRGVNMPGFLPETG
jgi:GNAT superfamily N-acetyltransferase